MTSTATLQIFKRATGFGSKSAIVSSEGVFSYKNLDEDSARVAAALLKDASDLKEARVAFLVPAGYSYVAIQWGIWRAGGIAVPLCVSHPTPELDYIIQDSDAAVVIYHSMFQDRMASIASTHPRRFLSPDDILKGKPGVLPELEKSRRAMIVYTSGTTGKPKGVISTHANIEAQVTSLVKAWEWKSEDSTLNILPLHHLHGIINILTCALWSGATCEIMPAFDATRVWERFLKGDMTLFMAVPSIYSRLAKHWQQSPAAAQKQMTAACQKMRLMISGSAALPVPLLEEWKQISGHVLLERYGMTEIGMALSNSLHGERMPGHVGSPLPGVEVRIVDEKGTVLPDGEQGEIQVSGPAVFLEYWRRSEETKKSFDGKWFRTGDIAIRKKGVYQILGRNSTDIIKTGGYKVSALEIEHELLAHPSIDECAVVGLPDPEWGERVSAAIKLKPNCQLGLDELRNWGKERLAVYKVPSRILILDQIPRNAMGKVVKPSVVTLFK